MSESVEQAALRRAAQDDLPAPWSSVLRALEASERLNDARFRHVQDLAEQIEVLHAENGELRDAVLALTNRIESLTRACNTNLAKQLDTLSDHVGRIRELEKARA